ncbi:MAG: hypothetical protein EGR07_03275 [Prevotella sp.]|nr:hypothetical protein [Prevotella sp.]
MDESAIFTFAFYSALIIIIGVVAIFKQSKKLCNKKLNDLQMTESQYSYCKNIVLSHLKTKEPLPKDDNLLNNYMAWWWKNSKDKAYSENDTLIVSAIIHGIVMLYVIFYNNRRLIPAYEGIIMLAIWGFSVLIFVYSLGFLISSLLGTKLFVGDADFKTFGYWLKIVCTCILCEILLVLFLKYGIDNQLFLRDY